MKGREETDGGRNGRGVMEGRGEGRRRCCSIHEPLVVSDDNHLEVGLLVAVVHEAPESKGEALRVGGVQVGGGLVQGQDAAVEAERLGQGQADDGARQDLRMPSGHRYESKEPSRLPMLEWGVPTEEAQGSMLMHQRREWRVDDEAIEETSW